MAGDKIDKHGDREAALAAEDEDDTIEVQLPKPPDGGWGWVIVLASVVANIIVDGITYTFGIFLPRFQEAFHQPKSTIALAGSLQIGIYLCAGPIVSALTNRFGCKRVTIAGSIIATMAFAMSTLVHSADLLILVYGVIGGFGFGMMYLPAIVIVGYYFEKRRALATGIAVCGSGIGMFIMAPLSDYLLQEYSWRGALLIIGGMVANGAVCGMLMRPLPIMQAGPVKSKAQANGNPKEVKPLITPSVNESEKPAIIGLTAAGTIASPPMASNNNSVLTQPSSVTKPKGNQFQFSSVPNIIYSSAKSGGKQSMLPLQGRQRARSHTMDNNDRLILRHVARELAHEPTPPARAPIGLSFIGISDINLNKIRETTHMNVSRRDLLVSGTKLHISSQNLHPPAYIRSAISVKSQYSVKSQTERILCSCLPETVQDTLLQMLDFSILKNTPYLFILIGNIFAMLGFYVPFVFIPERATSLGISDEKAAFLLSIIGITNTVGRVLTGVLANLNKIDSLVINNIAMLICGLATMVCPFCEDYYLLCAVAAVFGSCVAAYISLSSILLCEMLGIEQLTNAFGFLTLARGISSCAGSPLAGAIIDATGDMSLAFYVGGALIIIGSLFHFLLHTPCLRRQAPNPQSFELKNMEEID